MKKLVPLIPYNDYFFNCYINALISILSYYDKDYIIASYMNGYKPEFKKSCFPECEVTNNFIHTFERNFCFNDYNFEDKSKALEVVHEMIKQDRYLFVFVDLYYWDLTGFMKSVEHLAHPGLIVGYDENHVYALEDVQDVTITFDIHDYTNELFFQSMESQDVMFLKEKPADYRIMSLTKNIQPFKFEMDAIKENARIIINELEKEEFIHLVINEEFFCMGMEPKYLRSHTCYANRMLANSLLFQELKKREFITEAQEVKLTELCEEIKVGIDRVKFSIHRSYIANRKVNYGFIQEQWRLIVFKELCLWKLLLEYI